MLNSNQKKVALGCLAAFILVGLLVWGLYCGANMPLPKSFELVDRLAYAFQWLLLPLLLLCIGIGTIAKERFTSKAIDPLAHEESRKITINGHYVDNTQQQLIIYAISTLALSIFLEGEAIRIIPIFSIIFVIGRITFWIGYLINPIYRAFGMAMTECVGLFLGVYMALWFIVRVI